MTKPQSKIMTSGKLKGGADLCGRGAKAKPMAKMIIYLPENEMAELQITLRDARTEGALGTGNHAGRAIVEIVKQWKESRS